jgi:hypothetical protein
LRIGIVSAVPATDGLPVLTTDLSGPITLIRPGTARTPSVNVNVITSGGLAST